MDYQRFIRETHRDGAKPETFEEKLAELEGLRTPDKRTSRSLSRGIRHFRFALKRVMENRENPTRSRKRREVLYGYPHDGVQDEVYYMDTVSMRRKLAFTIVLDTTSSEGKYLVIANPKTHEGYPSGVRFTSLREAQRICWGKAEQMQYKNSSPDWRGSRWW